MKQQLSDLTDKVLYMIESERAELVDQARGMKYREHMDAEAIHGGAAYHTDAFITLTWDLQGTPVRMAVDTVQGRILCADVEVELEMGRRTTRVQLRLDL